MHIIPHFLSRKPDINCTVHFYDYYNHTVYFNDYYIPTVHFNDYYNRTAYFNGYYNFEVVLEFKLENKSNNRIGRCCYLHSGNFHQILNIIAQIACNLDLCQ